jgi:hypothetical protein
MLTQAERIRLLTELRNTSAGHIGGVSVSKINEGSKTVAEWLSLGDVAVLTQAVNDVVIGSSLGLTVGNQHVTGDDVRAAIAGGAEYSNGSVDANAVARAWFAIPAMLDMSDVEKVQRVRDSLNGYPGSQAAFDALSLVPGSLNDSLFGGVIEESDLNAVNAMDKGQ